MKRHVGPAYPSFPSRAACKIVGSQGPRMASPPSQDQNPNQPSAACAAGSGDLPDSEAESVCVHAMDFAIYENLARRVVDLRRAGNKVEIRL